METFNQSFTAHRAAPKDSKFNLSGTTVTTLDFGLIRPVFIRRVYRGDKFHVNMDSFVRLLPVGMPTLGEAYLETHAVFVPNKLLTPSWVPMITNRKSMVYNGNTIAITDGSIPFFTNFSVVNAFIESADAADALCYDGGAESDNADFTAGTGTDKKYYFFTSRGKALLGVLKGLGYRINWSTADTTKFSALPLLAYLKFYYDFVENPVRSDLTLLEQYFHPSADKVRGFAALFATNDFRDIAAFFMENSFTSDYFTSAWTSPNGNDVNQIDTFEFTSEPVTLRTSGNIRYPKIFGDGDGVTSEYGPNPSLTPSSAGIISYEQHQKMVALYNYMRRNNLVGTRYGQQLLARFGLSRGDIDDCRCTYLGHTKTPIEISDVMSTAAGTSEGLPVNQVSITGQYAGKGIAYGRNGNFDFDVPDYGYIIVFASVMPDVKYFQGRQRHTLAVNKFDWLTPEFEKVGTQAIRNDELFASFCDQDVYAHYANMFPPNGVYGFCPNYTEDKIGYDNLNGDFDIRSMANTLSPFHMFKVLRLPQLSDSSVSDEWKNTSALAYLGPNFRSRYDRMFSYYGIDVEHFICQFRFHVEAFRPMNTIVDSMLTDEELNGQYVEIAVNGLKK